MKYQVLKDPDSDLTELLAREFELDFLKARNISREISFDPFVNNYGILESLIGGALAKEVVKNGSFANYRNGTLDEYFNFLRIAATKTDFEEKLFDISAFYSIDSLKNYLEFLDLSGKNGTFDLSKLNLVNNRFFCLSNFKSKQYFDSLINCGHLTVSSHEHWCKSKRQKGSRSLNIIRAIAFQLRVSFSDLGLEKPEIEINYGTGTLKISSKTQENLKKIRGGLLKK